MRRKHKSQPNIPAVPLKKKKRAKPELDIKNPEIAITSQFASAVLNEYATFLAEELGRGFRKKKVPTTTTFEGFLKNLLGKKAREYTDALHKSAFNENVIWFTGDTRFSMDLGYVGGTELLTFLRDYDEACKHLDQVIGLLSEFPDRKMPGEKSPD